MKWQNPAYFMGKIRKKNLFFFFFSVKILPGMLSNNMIHILLLSSVSVVFVHI